MVSVRRPKKRFMNPRLLSCCSSAASSNMPLFISRNTLMIPYKMTRLSAAIAYRKVPETPVPIHPVT